MMQSPKVLADIGILLTSSKLARKSFLRDNRDKEMEADTVKLAPSILAADFARLGEQVAEAEQAGADRIHIDGMDGHFVPSLSMGAPIVQSLRRRTPLPLQIHIIILNPDSFLQEFVEDGFHCCLVTWEG